MTTTEQVLTEASRVYDRDDQIRVRCHNPVAAIYNHQSYYRKRLYEERLVNRTKHGT
jgi:hypothetical protein